MNRSSAVEGHPADPNAMYGLAGDFNRDGIPDLAITTAATLRLAARPTARCPSC